MTDVQFPHPTGAFTIWGFTTASGHMLQQGARERLGIVPRVIDLGSAGRFFFHTSCGDVGETEQAVAIKLGFARTTGKAPLSAQQMLDQKTVTPLDVRHQALQGNMLIACFSKNEPRFVVWKNLLSLPQFYYWTSGETVLASDSLRCLISMVGQVDLDESVLPLHYFYRHVPGPKTYFKNIQRLLSGELFRWHRGQLSVRLVQDLRPDPEARMFYQIDDESRAALHHELQGVVSAYLSDIESMGHRAANMLSGGVDSSLTQVLINQHQGTCRSFSWAPVRTPSFEFEIQYAHTASQLLQTNHTFVHFTPEDYPQLVMDAIDILGQPVISDVEPSKLALARFVQEQVPDTRYYWTALGADSLFGMDVAQKIKILHLAARVPGSRLALQAAGRLLKPFTPRALTCFQAAQMLVQGYHRDLFNAPSNTISMYSDIDMACRSFGERAVREAFTYRCDLEAQYLGSPDETERVHIIDLLTDSYEIEVQSGQLFLAQNKEQVYPFMDSDTIRASLAFRPQIKYMRGWQVKPLLKDLLAQHGFAMITRRRKGGSAFTDDLYEWMRGGPLHELVSDIQRPGFIGQADWEQLLKSPDHTLWSLMTLDIFQKRVLKGTRRSQASGLAMSIVPAYA